MLLVLLQGDTHRLHSKQDDFMNLLFFPWQGGEDDTQFEPNIVKDSSPDAWRYQGVKELDGFDTWGL